MSNVKNICFYTLYIYTLFLLLFFFLIYRLKIDIPTLNRKNPYKQWAKTMSILVSILKSVSIFRHYHLKIRSINNKCILNSYVGTFSSGTYIVHPTQSPNGILFKIIISIPQIYTFYFGICFRIHFSKKTLGYMLRHIIGLDMCSKRAIYTFHVVEAKKKTLSKSLGGCLFFSVTSFFLAFFLWHVCTRVYAHARTL